MFAVICYILTTKTTTTKKHAQPEMTAVWAAFVFPRNHEMRTKKLPAVRQQSQPLHCHRKPSLTVKDSNISY